MLLLRTLLYFNSSRIRIFLTRYSVQEFLPHFSLHRIVPRPLTGAVSLARTEIACVPTNRGPGRQTEAAACRGPNSRPGARGTQRLRVFWVPRLLPPPTPLGSSRRQKVTPPPSLVPPAPHPPRASLGPSAPRRGAGPLRAAGVLGPAHTAALGCSEPIAPHGEGSGAGSV